MYLLNLIFFGAECKWIRFTSFEWWRLLQSHNKIPQWHHSQMGMFLFDFRNIWGLCYCDSWKCINYDMGKCDLINFMLLLYSDLFPWKFLCVQKDPKTGELEGLSFDFNLCEAVATWEQVSRLFCLSLFVILLFNCMH